MSWTREESLQVDFPPLLPFYGLKKLPINVLRQHGLFLDPRISLKIRRRSLVGSLSYVLNQYKNAREATSSPPAFVLEGG